MKEIMITKEEIDSVWGNANFGDGDRLDIIKLATLKRACGYCNGFTATQILFNLGLTTKKDKLTKRGLFCMYEWFSNGLNT